MAECAFNIAEWVDRQVVGPGGMDDYEAHELVIWHVPDRIATARWIVRCLGNPRNEGSREVVMALMRRHEVEANLSED